MTNPTNQKLAGFALAVLTIVLAATVAKQYAAELIPLATFILGVVGIQLGAKQS